MFTGQSRKEIPKWINVILINLFNCSKLHTVDLLNNTFGLVTIEPLEKVLWKHTALKQFSLSNNALGAEACIFYC